MKKFNYFYFGLMTLLWFVVDGLLSRLTLYHPAWLLLLPAYVCWYLLSAPLFYDIRKKKGLKENFSSACCLQAQWATVWVDSYHNELAYLCMWNPFRIHYLPLDAVSHVKAEIHYSKDKEFVHYVNLTFDIDGKPNRIRVDTGGLGRRFYSETNGKELVDRTRQFAVVLNGSRSCDVI